MTWTPQPESGPDARPAGGTVAGVLVCNYHRDVLGGMRTAHGSAEGLARRVATIAAPPETEAETERIRKPAWAAFCE